MPRKLHISKLSFSVGLLFVTLLTIVIIPKTRQATLRTLSQPESTPENLVFLPVIQEDLARLATEEPLVDGASLPPSWVDIDPNAQDIETEGTAEAINTPIPYPIIPTPDLNTTVSPELAKIEITNARYLDLPSKTHSFFGKVVWSPDSQKFVGHFAAWMDGLDEDHLYIGEVETGNFTLWQKNGIWPTWSRDGNYVYYLAPRRDGTVVAVNEYISRPYVDLYRQSVNDGKSELLLSDVIPPQVAVAQVIESANTNLIMLDPMSRISLMPPANDLIEINKQGKQALPLSFIDATATNPSTISAAPSSFSVSPNGKILVNIHFGASSQLLNLETFEQIGEIQGLGSPINVAWASNGSMLAYTNRSGLFTYNVITGETQSVITNERLGFTENDPRGGLAWPVWLEGDQQILFVALSQDWVDRNQAASDVNLDYFTFVVTSNGKEVKPLGRFAVESVSSNKRYAFVRQLDYTTGYFSAALANINY